MNIKSFSLTNANNNKKTPFTQLTFVQPKNTYLIEELGVPQRYVDAISNSNAIRNVSKHFRIKVWGHPPMQRFSNSGEKLNKSNPMNNLINLSISRKTKRNKIRTVLNKIGITAVNPPKEAVITFENIHSDATLEEVKGLNLDYIHNLVAESGL